MQTLTDRMQLEDDENIVRAVRKHWFVLLATSLPPLLICTVIIGGYVLLCQTSAFQEMISTVSNAPALTLFGISIVLLITWISLFLVWTDYYLDLWIVTDRRIIAIDQRGLFKRIIASFRFERLQDINIDIDGFIATFLDFGTLRAQTAGHSDEFNIRGVPDPRGIKAIIIAASDKLMANRSDVPAVPQDTEEVH